MDYTNDLVAQAETLAAWDSHRPKQASLRRAVSAAYYALFHEIVDRAVGSLVSVNDASGPIGNRLRRIIRHDSVLRASKWFAGTLPPAVQAMRPASDAAPHPVEARLAQVCQLFTDLQAERHRADYDLSAPFARGETMRRIADAKSAIESLRSLSAEGDTLIFYLGCVVGDGLTRNV